MKTKQLVWTIGAILTLAIILSISLIDKKQETIIVHNPTYKGISSKALNLLRVECNDSSTVLDMEVTGPPKNWVRLKSSIKLVTENNQEFKTIMREKYASRYENLVYAETEAPLFLNDF